MCEQPPRAPAINFRLEVYGWHDDGGELCIYIFNLDQPASRIHLIENIAKDALRTFWSFRRRVFDSLGDWLTCPQVERRGADFSAEWQAIVEQAVADGELERKRNSGP